MSAFYGGLYKFEYPEFKIIMLDLVLRYGDMHPECIIRQAAHTNHLIALYEAEIRQEESENCDDPITKEE